MLACILRFIMLLRSLAILRGYPAMYRFAVVMSTQASVRFQYLIYFMTLTIAILASVSSTSQLVVELLQAAASNILIQSCFVSE